MVVAMFEPEDEDDFVAEIKHEGMKLIAQGLRNVLTVRLAHEMEAWAERLSYLDYMRFLAWKQRNG